MIAVGILVFGHIQSILVILQLRCAQPGWQDGFEAGLAARRDGDP